MTGPVPETEAVAAAHAARDGGRRVVFTNGAFDLLHAGHVGILEEAAALGDVLVVAVNADETVRRAKGAGRPVQSACERAEAVAALRCVDHVFLFDDASVDRLLETIRPAVHAKGNDYGPDTLPERETNRRLDIEMAFVGGEKRYATSRLVARAAAAGEARDRVRRISTDQVEGFALRQAQPFLRRHGWLDLERLATTDEGRVVERHRTRAVRRIDVEGVGLFVKTTHPAERKRSPIVELQHHLALRAAGFRAPEPWLALEGRVAGTPCGVLVTREAAGVPLDDWLRAAWPRAGARTRLAIADGLGRTLRALHTARFLPTDLQAWHWLVDGSPAWGRNALTLLDLMRLPRARGRVKPKHGAVGLAALELSLRPVMEARGRLAVLRAYLGGSLSSARPWLRAIDKRVAHIKERGTFRHLADEESTRS